MFGLLLTPEGRDCASIDECKADWESGKDFRIVDGPLCSKRDLPIMKDSGFTAALFLSTAGKPLYELPLVERREPEPCL